MNESDLIGEPVGRNCCQDPTGKPQKHHLKHRDRLGTAAVMSHRCKTTAAPGCVRQSRLSCYFHANQSVAALRCGRLSPAHDHGTAGLALNCLKQLTHCCDLFMSEMYTTTISLCLLLAVLEKNCL